MTRQELKQLISEVVSEAFGSQPNSGRGYIPLRGFDHAEIPVDYKVRVYKGTNAPDDPSTLEFDSLVTSEDVTLDELAPQSSMDEKLIQLYRLASKKLGGTTSDYVVIPKGTNVIALNDALNGWIDADIQALQDQLVSKLMGRLNEAPRVFAGTYGRLTDRRSGKIYRVGDKVDSSRLTGGGDWAEITEINPEDSNLTIRYLDGPRKGATILIAPYSIGADFK